MGAIDTLQFHIDKLRGNEGEQYVAGMMRSWGYTVKEAPDRFFPDYDLFCSRVHGGKYNAFTIEVKKDFWYDKTGNLCLEHDSLDDSKADFFAICAGDPIKAVFLMPLPEARKFAHQAKEYIQVVGKRKDGKPNWGACGRFSKLCVSGDNQPFQLLRRRLCHRSDQNCSTNY